MERAPERSPNHPSVASVAGRRRRSAQSARAAGPRRLVSPLFVADVAGTAQTPASLGRLGVEGTTEEMGAGACTQTPGAPAAGRSAAATRQRDKCALPHGDSAVPHGSPHPSLKKHHQHILFRRGCLAEWGIRCCCGRDGDAVLTCAPCGVAGCLPVADTRRPGNAQDSQGRRRLSSACRAFGHGRLHRRAHASGPA